MTRDDEARALVALYEDRRALERIAAEEMTGAAFDAAMSKGDELDAACESFRRRYFPGRFRVVAVGAGVYSVSRTGRSKRIYDALGFAAVSVLRGKVA